MEKEISKLQIIEDESFKAGKKYVSTTPKGAPSFQVMGKGLASWNLTIRAMKLKLVLKAENQTQ